MGQEPPQEKPFVVRIFIIVGVALLMLGGALLVGMTAQLLPILFAGIMLSIFLRTITDGVMKVTRLPNGWALALTCILLMSVLIFSVVLLAPSVTEQVNELRKSIPRSIDHVRLMLEQSRWGHWLVGIFPSAGNNAPPPNGIVTKAAGFVFNTVGAVISVAVVAFIGLYLAAQPSLYQEGLIRLVPVGHRTRARQIFAEIGHELRWWLLGQIIAMALIGTLISTGLYFLGIPMALTLGIFSGFMNFIPNFGPILSGAIASLLAMTISFDTALWVVALFIAVQSFETYLVTPMIQQRTVDLPPALTIAAQVLFGFLIGIGGVAFAAPFVVVILVVVKMVYVEDILGDVTMRPNVT